MRKFVSVVIAVSFLALLVTTSVMTMGGHGEGERRGGPPIATASGGPAERGPHRGEHGFFPMGLHQLAGFSLLLFGCFHVVYNGKPLMSYVGLRKRASRPRSE